MGQLPLFPWPPSTPGDQNTHAVFIRKTGQKGRMDEHKFTNSLDRTTHMGPFYLYYIKTLITNPE